MSEYDYETTLTFRKTKMFWVELNKQMVIKERNTLNNDGLYHLVFFSSAPIDFNDALDSRGCINTSASGVELITSGYTDTEFHLGVEWLDNGENGFNLFVDEWEDNTDIESGQVDVNIPIDEHETLEVKVVALCKTTASDTGTDYVVAYAWANTPITCQNYITLMKGSSIVGHNSCKVV